ncbi:tRNA (adenosine(37)-N6)-dimethylallyltransferase MiaA [Maridesulfovibrio sp.]|uniref:tRNA (adenosine(37)-N6)-dimethylallyltransferase MiaA n=1 Tax=Maridesulfovibrio sp. TaxID=2795000 RepID=UPI002A18DD45|nr:tRNA (adenosine(37)-N6)-dimethylallyltransferase MiaA [Maridesulfovibrio sp.]
MSKRPVICILGPTGAGKTAAALGLAEVFGVRVINFDSRQVYEDFPIITAQPSPEEQAVCPHELYGFLPTSEAITAAAFVRMAEERIDAAAGDELPVLVGGTGMYLQSLTSGLAPIPDIPAEIRERIRGRAELEGGPALYAELEKVDPEYCKRTHPNNRQRNARALEVYEATGKTFTWWHNREVPPSPYEFLKIGIGIELAELTPLLGLRIEKMLEAGAVDEARSAWEKCPDERAPGWSGIGCSELLSFIRGGADMEETVRAWAGNTRAYAKRQLTWFKREKDINWFAPDEHRAAVDFVRRWLADCSRAG